MGLDNFFLVFGTWYGFFAIRKFGGISKRMEKWSEFCILFMFVILLSDLFCVSLM
jgi:hypothetical protein